MRQSCRAAIGLTKAIHFAALLLVTGGLLGVGQRAFAEQGSKASEETTARAKTLIESVMKERERIVSAVVHVRGSVVFTKDAPPPERTIRGMYAFDHAQGALRFDSSRKMTIRVANVGPGAPKNDIKALLANAEEEEIDQKLRYLRTRDLCARWLMPTRNSVSQVYLGPPDQQMGGGIAATHCMSDLRACGLISAFDFPDRPNGNFETGRGIQQHCDPLLEMAVVSVTETRRQAVIVLRSKYSEHHLTIDTAQQFTPIEYVQSWKKGPGNSSDGSATSRVKWGEVNGIMVPKSFSCEFDVPDENYFRCYNFICLWHGVNQPVDEKNFDYKTFPDIPLNTEVFDGRRTAVVGFWTEAGIIGPEEDFDEHAPILDPKAAQPELPPGKQPLADGEKAGEERDDNGLDMAFVWCPPGQFVMGSLKTEKERFDGEDQVEVTLSHGFWIGKFEVTQGEWAKLKTPLLWKGQEYVTEGDDYPATYLSWENAMAFCQKLTRQEHAAGRLPKGWHYTLPTEAQWEYACRGGSKTSFCFGDDLAELADYAWTRENAAGNAAQRHPQPVGQKRPNSFGIYDMHGNVSEWCRDGWKKKLPGGTDPFVVVPVDELRVVRGGHFNYPGLMCRSATRDDHRAVDRSDFMGEIGLRVVLCRVERKSD